MLRVNQKNHKSSGEGKVPVEVCVLAGGLSSRMGQDKARLRLQGRTLLGWVRRIGREANLPVRVIRGDLVVRCGPLGGIYTALKTTRADAVLFLACDMPLVSAEMIEKLMRRLTGKMVAVFTRHDGMAGFPFLLRRAALDVVEMQLAARMFSLQTLAKGSRNVSMPEPWRLMNINTPEDWRAAREIIAQRYKKSRKQ